MLIARTFTFSFFILLISHYGFSCSLYAEPLEIIHVRPAEVIPINGLWNFKTQTLGEVRKIYTGKPLVEQGISFPVHGEYEVKVFYDDSEIAKAQGIFLDRIHEADRTYFNGILIGKTGKFLPEGDYSPNWYVRRLYQIPEHLIKKNSYNTVRVEFFSANSGFEGGIFRGVPLIGDYSILRERLLDEDIVIIAIASLFMGILVYQGLIFILRNKSYPSLFLALTCLAFILWRVPLINKVNSSGINFQFLMRIFFVSQTLFPLGLAFFCHSLYKTGFQKMELVSIFAISVIAALHIFPVPIELRLNLIIVWEGLVLFLAFFVIKITLKEAGKKKKEAMFVGTGFALLVILSAMDIIIDNTTGKNIFLTQYGFLSVVFMAAVSISYQNAVIHKEIERLNVSLEKIVEDRTQELSSKNKIFENDLLIAAGLQSRLIPRGKPKIADLSLESVYLPMDKIGGDYFDWAVLSESKIGFIICDVLGHGISAAFISSMLKVSFMDLSKKTENPSELLSKMNSQLIEVINKNYISAIYAIFDLREMEIRYSVAGHPPLICLNHLTGNVTFLQGRGALLGWREVIHPVVNTKAIHEGDRYLFYTDGLTETMNEKDEIFGEEKVFSVLKANSQMNSLELTKKILSEIISFSRTDKFNDDVTYFIVDVSSNR